MSISNESPSCNPAETGTASYDSHATMCLHCGAELAAERDNGTSPGCGETDYLGPDGSTWCPGDGARYPTRKAWLDDVRLYGYDGRACQYHQPVYVNVRQLAELMTEFSRVILKLAA